MVHVSEEGSLIDGVRLTVDASVDARGAHGRVFTDNVNDSAPNGSFRFTVTSFTRVGARVTLKDSDTSTNASFEPMGHKAGGEIVIDASSDSLICAGGMVQVLDRLTDPNQHTITPSEGDCVTKG